MSDSESFDIFFAGQTLEGFAQEQVREGLGKLFKADAAKLQRLFSGSRQLIKRGCDRETALTYQRAMKAVGARPLIVPHSRPEAAATPAPSPAADAPADAAALTLAPSGSDVLTAEERHAWEPAQIDTSHLQAEPAGEPLAEKPPEVAQVAAPDFGLAALGADLGPGAGSEAPPAPDVSGLSVAAENFDLSDCAPAPAAAPDLQLDHLAVDDSGGDLLRDEERRRPQAEAPDTSHLSLSDTPRED